MAAIPGIHTDLAFSDRSILAKGPSKWLPLQVSATGVRFGNRDLATAAQCEFCSRVRLAVDVRVEGYIQPY